MAYTRGFRNPKSLADHYQDHFLLLRIGTIVEYGKRADAFVGGPKKFGTFECKRRCGHRLRYNVITKEFGILDQSGIILTYFIPERQYTGKYCNLCYFHSECGK